MSSNHCSLLSNIFQPNRHSGDSNQSPPSVDKQKTIEDIASFKDNDILTLEVLVANQPKLFREILDEFVSNHSENAYEKTGDFLKHAGANPNLKTKAGEPHLSVAIRKNNPRAFDFLFLRNDDLAKGKPNIQPQGLVQVNATDRYGTSPLSVAAREGKRAAVKKLLAYGANPLQENRFGKTALDFAALRGEREILNALIEHCGEELLPEKKAQLKALADSQQELIQAFQDLQPEEKKAALQAAVQDGRLEDMMALVTVGTPLNERDNNGYLLIHHAAKNGHVPVIQALLEMGAPLDKRQGVDRVTPLMSAIQSGSLPAVQLFVEEGADIEKRDVNGISPLDQASANGQLNMITYLLQSGANVNAVSHKGETALMSAAIAPNLPALQLLLASGADAKLRDTSDYDALLSAALLNNDQVIQPLVDAGAEINRMNRNNAITPLMVAAEDGNIATVRALLNAGVDLKTQGPRAVEIARENDYEDTANLILAHPNYPAQENEDV